MLELQPDSITDLYCFIDDLIPSPKKPLGGRPELLSDSELITGMVWSTLAAKSKTIKDVHENLRLHLRREFPGLPKYNGFLEHCHRALPKLVSCLQSLLCSDAPFRILDSTFLEVCTNQRADKHKTARSIASWGKNYQGWHYGFKLHASINKAGALSGIYITPADVHDIHGMLHILDKQTKLAVGDTHYGASVMGRKVFENYGTIIIAPPHPSQKKKLMASWQQKVLSMRSKIESVFDYLKEHLSLVSSFPRSINGYLLHYVRILLSYQTGLV